MKTPADVNVKQDDEENVRLREVLKALRLTIKELAERTGVNHRTIENNLSARRRPSADLLRGLHHRLGISVDWLFSGQGPMFRDGRMVAEPSAAVPSVPTIQEAPGVYPENCADPRFRAIREFLAHWYLTREESERSWLTVQLCRAVPELSPFLAAQSDLYQKSAGGGVTRDGSK